MIEVVNEQVFRVGSHGDRFRQITLEKIALGWQQHTSGDPFTKFLEDHSRVFVCNKFPDDTALLFARMVFAWGGIKPPNYRLFRQSLAVLQDEIGDRALAKFLLDGKYLSEEGRYLEAIEVFQPFQGIRVSFRSKLLRFMAPDNSAVLDSRIQNWLGYQDNAESYAAFVTDCIQMRDHLNNVCHPHPAARQWRTVDVEMGIYMTAKDNP